MASVYFEGQHNEVAEFGYHRDGKRGKKQRMAELVGIRQVFLRKAKRTQGHAVVSLLALKLGRDMDP